MTRPLLQFLLRRNIVLTTILYAILTNDGSAYCPTLGGLTYDILGPFPTGGRVGAGDPVEAFGGITKIPRADNTAYRSELVDGGNVKWNKTVASREGIVIIEYANVRWEYLQKALGLAVTTNVGGWALTDFDVEVAGDYRIFCGGTSAFFVDDVRYVGDAGSFLAWWGDNSWIKWPLHLTKGRHTLRVRAHGKFQCYIDCQDTPSHKFYALTATADSLFNQGLVNRVPDLVDGSLASPMLSFPIVNSYVFSITGMGIRVLDASQKVNIRTVEILDDIRVTPGQAYPLSVRMDLDVPQCRENVTLRYLLNATFGDGSSDQIAHPVTFQCKKFNVGAYSFTFLDHDRTVQTAAVIPPTDGCIQPDGCPILFATHGAGVDATSPSWTNAFAPRKNAWILLPSNRAKYGYNWEGIGRINGLAALRYFSKYLPGVSLLVVDKYKANSESLLFTGHSMGGHGCLIYSTNYADKAIGSMCAAGWLRLEHYTPEFQDVGESFSDPTLTAILDSSVAAYHTDVTAVNMKGIPFMARTGGNDEDVIPWNLRRFARLIDAVNGISGFAQISEVPGKPHWWDTIMNAPVVNEFYQSVLQRGKPPIPLSFTIRAINLWNEGRGGITILQFETPSTSGWIDVNIDAKVGIWYLRTSNIRRFGLQDVSGVVMPLRTKFIIDGNEFPIDKKLPDSHFCKLEGEWKRCNGMEWITKERSKINCGPSHQIYFRPSVIVYGTLNQFLERQLYQHALLLSNSIFYQGHGVSQIFKDTEVRENLRLIGKSNVIIIGGSNVNSFFDIVYSSSTAKISSTFSKSTGAFSLGPHSFSGESIGVILFGAVDFENKGNFTDQHVAIIAGTDARGIAQAADAFPTGASSRIPDYCVFGKDFSWKSSGDLLTAGYFGNEWEFRGDISYPRSIVTKISQVSGTATK